jgi:putative peptide zinc metalloprotease protein
VIFNANPLLRYDGYYILSDLLEIPNLQQKAKDYALGLIKRHVFGVKNPLPLPPVGQRIWLFFYAIASGIYRVFVGVMIILVVTNQVPVLGVLMALGGVVTWLVVPVGKILHYLLLDPELHRKRFRAAAFVGAVAAAIVVLVGIIKFPAHFEATGMAEEDADQKAILNASQAGFVTEVLVKPGQSVSKGTPLLKLRDDQLVANLKVKQHELAAMEVRLDSDRSARPNMIISDQEQLNYLSQEIQVIQRQQTELTISAPLDGRVIAGDLDELKGKYVHDGEPLGITVAKTNVVYVYALLDQKDAALPFAEEPSNVEVRFSGARGTVVKNDAQHPDRVKIVRWEPGATTDSRSSSLTTAAGEEGIPDPNDKTGRKLAVAAFPVVVAVQNDGNFQPGQRAYLRFDIKKRPLMWQWKRRFQQLIQTQSANNKWL